MDETWVRPFPSDTIPRDAYALTVAAILTTSQGMKFKGFVAVDTADGFQVSGFGMPFPQYKFVPINPSEADRVSFAKLIEATPNEVSPANYQVRVALEGERAPRKGAIV